MPVQHLFDSSGTWIAFRKGKYLYSPKGTWIGWLPWDDEHVVDRAGKYLGHIVLPNRLLRRLHTPYRGYPGYPGYPGYAGYPGYPGYAGYFRMPAGMTDVKLGTQDD